MVEPVAIIIWEGSTMDFVTAAIPVLGWFGFLGVFAAIVAVVQWREATR